jgi:hypothetical protein
MISKDSAATSRFSIGYWRNTCRACQNARKRKQYRYKTAHAVKKPNPYKQAKSLRLRRLIEKYDRLFAIMASKKISMDTLAGDVDIFLENTDRLSRKTA